MSPNSSLLGATTPAATRRRPSFSYVRFPGQARAEDKEWLDKEGLCAGCCRAGTEGEGEEEPSRGRGQRDQALEGLGSSLCVLAGLGKTPPTGQITTQESRSHI